MDFNNKYLKKYSTFDLIFKRGPPNNERQGEPAWTSTWIAEQLQPTLVQFLSLWHGSEVNHMNFYIESQPFKISGIVEFSEGLRHRVDPQRPEEFQIEDYIFVFYPRDCDSSQYQPLEAWEKLNSEKAVIKYPQPLLLPNGRTIHFEALKEVVDAGISIANTIKDVGLEVYKIYKDKKDRNQTRLAVIHKTGNDISAIFKGTCNVFIYKDTDRHQGTTDFYGVLYKDAFTVANTPYNIFVFREGVYRTTSNCRREHHWFASGEENGYERLSFWKKWLKIFQHPERNFTFERQGRILSRGYLEEARARAKDYLNPAPGNPHNFR